MLKRRYEILLPLKFNDGRPVPAELFYETREDLLARFEGLSWVTHPIEGMWKQEGITVCINCGNITSSVPEVELQELRRGAGGDESAA